MRRILLAVTLSVAVHVAGVAIAVGFGLWQVASLAPAMKLPPISVEVKDLPLGAPAAKEPEPEPEAAAPRARRPPRAKVATTTQGVSVPVADAGAPPDRRDAAPPRRGAYDGGGGVDGGRRRPGDLREHGPAGSRLIALLRLDRVRASPGSEATIAAIDQLLLLLPDRRRLIEGSGLDLYRDFDTLLVATPNPADDAVTFLAVRHRLREAALTAGLDRGGKAQGKPITWQTIAGRPVGLRRRPAATGAFLDRDDRIIALPDPSLAVMATSAYASQLLDVDLAARPGGSADGGTPGPQGGAGPRKPPSRGRWQTLAARIEAEEAAIPDDAAFLMMATGLFGPPPPPSGMVVPPTRGVSDDQPPQSFGGDGSPPPSVATLVVGLEAPYVEASAEFATEAQAKRWERELPLWRRKLLTNPLVFVGGFATLIGRVESSREGRTMYLRVETSVEELQRLLNLVATLTRTAIRSR